MTGAAKVFAASALTLALCSTTAWAQSNARAPITTTPEIVQQPGADVRTVTPGTLHQGFDAVQTPSSSAPLPLPKVQQDHGVSYVSGGVSDDERDQLAQLAYGYSLELEMAQVNPAGAPNPYVANVRVAVTDENGRPVLNAISDGPIFYAKLPPGRYRVAATTQDGRTATRQIQLMGRGTQKIGLRWSAEGPLG